MDWSVIGQGLPTFASAFWTTSWLSAIGIALATVIGILAALVRYYDVPMLGRVRRGMAHRQSRDKMTLVKVS